MAQYGTVWTRTGRNKEANNLAGGPQITLTHLAVGDGNGAAASPAWRSIPTIRPTSL